MDLTRAATLDTVILEDYAVSGSIGDQVNGFFCC